MRDRRCGLAVMAKAPVPGYAKTRLVPRLGAEGAAALHAVLLERTLRVAAGSGLDAAVWCAPSSAAPELAALRASHAVRDQPEGDLGHRMRAALEAHLARAPFAIVVGTDCPELSGSHLAAMRDALAAGADAALLPAVDGGYAALGLARAEPRLFDDVPWGSGRVLAVTRQRLRELGWTALELAPVRDVDEPADVDWLLASGLLDVAERARIEPYVGRDREER